MNEPHILALPEATPAETHADAMQTIFRGLRRLREIAPPTPADAAFHELLSDAFYLRLVAQGGAQPEDVSREVAAEFAACGEHFDAALALAAARLEIPSAVAGKTASLREAREALLGVLSHVSADLGQLHHHLSGDAAQDRALALSLRVYEARRAAEAAFDLAVKERVSEMRLPEPSGAEIDGELARAMGHAGYAMDLALERMLQNLGRTPEVFSAAYGLKRAAAALRRIAPAAFEAKEEQARRAREAEARALGEFYLVRVEGEVVERATLEAALEVAEDYDDAQVLRVCGHVVEDVTPEAEDEGPYESPAELRAAAAVDAMKQGDHLAHLAAE